MILFQQRTGVSMNIQQLKFFVTISEYKSFTVAANELYISQSSLSKQIKSLEKELGVKLFNRTTRDISLTPIGSQLVLNANKILSECDNMLQQVDRYKNNQHYTIKIGSIPVLNQYGLTPLITDFEQKHPNIKLNVVETTKSALLNMLMRFDIDLGITRTGGINASLFDEYSIINDELFLVVSEHNPLSDFNEIALSDLKDEHFILMGSDPYYIHFYTNLFSSVDICPHIEYSNMRLETICTYVSENMGVSLIMKKMIEHIQCPCLKIIKLKEKPCWPISIVNRKEGVSKACLSFIDHLSNSCK